MNFTELFEGATPKLPGAVGGIKVMSMDQFLAQSGDEPEEKIDEMSSEELDKMSPEELAQFTHKARTDKSKIDPKTIDQAYGKSMDIMFPNRNKQSKQSTNHKQQGVSEAGVTGSNRSAETIAKQKEWNSSSASDSTQDTKTFSYQGYTISFTPDKLNIYLGGDLVFSRKGNFANPTKKQLVAARLSIGKIIDNKRRESLVHSAVQKSK